MRILVIKACGLHIGYLGCYGNDWIATPNLDRLAADGIVFDRHIVDAPETGDADGDWLDQARGRLDRLDAPRAIVHTAGPTLSAPWRLSDDLLTMYTEDDEIEPWPDPPVGELHDAEAILRVQDTYAAAVTWFDAQVGQLLDDIAKRPWADELLLVFTASSGYPLGEHGRLGWDRPWLYEEVVHVPLIVRWPGRLSAGMRIAALTQPEDLTNGLLGWMGGWPEKPGVEALIQGTTDLLRPHALSSWRVGSRSEHALRTPEWTLIVPKEQDPADSPRARQLYVKPDDRWEVNNIADREFEKTDELEALLGASLP
jgi:arylsulfatase A-like enzyme